MTITGVRERGYAVSVQLNGPLAPEVTMTARDAVRAAIGTRRGPVLRADVRVVRYADPELTRPVAAYATVSLNGNPVRVHTTERTPDEAIRELARVLRAALDRLEQDLRWRSGSSWALAGVPSAGRLRTPGVVSGECSIDQAIGVLELLDRDFQLFRDAGTGEDTLVHRAGPTGYRLVQARRAPLYVCPETAVSIDCTPAPSLTVEEAAARLAAGERPYVFFVDVTTGRGAVLHVRRDGDHGLVALG
ncbi:sigma 54 modulation/S30EA ribosomal C-terminal domain-containing protein [Cryptosporangium phraense]|uniref:Sigma 54 modulation/S30EA ribosomal protein C-terminal domain-containing protein n=1 Tax=Cryptosporangium phraense TaxID=2593070 RepID=A0A545AZK8_9ACTN|nr:sigma 54 modulation/S30EA ribosomal C-terminal domain-containing protein [Cryptosporangium phraense]TQS46045.1 hypothetical protein FL583_06035 [Cryptosporangium phraense]